MNTKEREQKSDAIWLDFSQRWFTLLHSTRPFVFREHQDLTEHAVSGLETVRDINVASRIIQDMSGATIDIRLSYGVSVENIFQVEVSAGPSYNEIKKLPNKVLLWCAICRCIYYKMEGSIVRRVIPSDNSCLFNAIGYVMDHDKSKAPELRQVIAATVASDPTKYSEAFLGKPNEEYCAWILNPEKWGEKFLLLGFGDSLQLFFDWCNRAFNISRLLWSRNCRAYDIQTTRCDLYGQEKKYRERVMLIYDGLHYDALAMSPADGAPEEFDQTIFAVNPDRTIGTYESLALNLVKDQQRKRSYTVTANFTLRCGVCQIGVIGQKEAVEHAQATGHVNFQEYK
ncbi:hypothetical protein L1987_08075 [Smallanthus sonchifolius]|uniref:Uncharacterized protein n=1 Tax=Smallanthus sonchifolius TaxID=185202 RepID=A0ACB9JMP2_9ASTR|nr:hypothetical protein L1987_08075 [Smallanthus sonchifolius]